MTQRARPVTENPRVVGSIPPLATIPPRPIDAGYLLLQSFLRRNCLLLCPLLRGRQLLACHEGSGSSRSRATSRSRRALFTRPSPQWAQNSCALSLHGNRAQHNEEIGMKRIIRLFAGVLFICASSAAMAQSADGGMRIAVVSMETQRPLEGVTVTVTDRDGNVITGRTTADGIVELSDLDIGLYAVTADGPGLVAAREPSVRVVGRKVTPLNLEMLARTEALEEVVVLARAQTADPHGAASNSLLNREELRSAAGTGSDVLRALDGLPGLISDGDFASFSVRGRGPRDNLILIDDVPFDRVVHFDQTLGEEEDIGGGGRYSIFAPNSIASAEFSPGGWSAAYGGRSGSLLKLDVAGGSPTPSASLRVDIAGLEFGYEGPSGIHDDTTMYFTARQFDFGEVFDMIDELDIGDPELTDIVLKTVTSLDEDNTIEFLGVYAPEEYTRTSTTSSSLRTSRTCR